MNERSRKKQNSRNSEENYGNFRSIISNVASEFFANTTIHGLNYLGARDKSLPEIVWWFIVFVLNFTACTYLIKETWNYWVESPVIVSFSPIQTPIWHIPFPAVTICPTNRVKQSVFKYSDMVSKNTYKHLTGEQKNLFWDLTIICEYEFKNTTIHDRIRLERVYANIVQAASSMSEIIKSVRFGDQEYKQIDKLFTHHFTEDGLCFTFNSLGLNDIYTNENTNRKIITQNRINEWFNVEEGYLKNATINSYPKRTSQDGSAAGLQLVLQFDTLERNMKCGSGIIGYKIFLHNPGDVPRIRQNYMLMPGNKQSSLFIIPEMVTTSNGLLNIHPRDRNCYFSNEKSLRYYAQYTQNNCITECLLNMTVSKCGCIPYFMPRDNATPICSYDDSYCLKDMKRMLIDFDLKTGRYFHLEESKNRKIYEACVCWPSCASLDYLADITYTDYIHRNITSQTAADTMETTLVNVVFKEQQFTAMHRSELHSPIDFIANCGGILGLCLGVSLLSILEIVYFLIIRALCKIKTISKKSIK